MSPSRESEMDKKIKALEEIVGKQGQELKKFRQASKSASKEILIRRMHHRKMLVRHKWFTHRYRQFFWPIVRC